MEIQFTDYDYFKNTTKFKVISEEPFYCDNFTFHYSPDYLYFGLLNAPTLALAKNTDNLDSVIQRATHPVKFHNITGVFTFIGIRLKIVNKSNTDLSVMGHFNPADYNTDYSLDFAV